MKEVKDYIRKVESLREALALALEEADSFLATAAGNKAPEEVKKSYKLLAELRKHENGLPKHDFHTVAKRVGYDVRGTAGFFKGKNASLTHIPAGNGEDRVFLTKRGHALLADVAI